MRIACLGGGPAGLYFSISMKLRDPRHHIDVFERNRAADTFGWGVVLSSETLEHLEANDPGKPLAPFARTRCRFALRARGHQPRELSRL